MQPAQEKYKYEYTGKLDMETGYYYGVYPDNFGSARYYNPTLSQWLSTDPLAEKYPGMSPYTYTADNPVMLVDPTGMKWKTPKDEKRARRTIKQIKRKIKYYNKHKKKYSDVDERIAELKKSLDDIEKMDKDEDLYYHFEKGGNKPMTTRKGNTVTMAYSDSGNKIHEIRHGGQIARRELLVDENGKAENYGYRFEIDAYRAELAFSKQIEYLPYLSDDILNEAVKEAIFNGQHINKYIFNKYKRKVNSLKDINLKFLNNMYDYKGFEFKKIYNFNGK